jgi:PKD repeat protein
MKILSICLVFLLSGSSLFSQSFTCGSSITINHAEGNVAPVSKTVTYATVKNIPGDTSKCWITSNLGADHQATDVSDNTEASAGWYWQFNRTQGYMHDGTTRTPDAAWITVINENFNWEQVNDPCGLELGGGWRIPTYTEWSNVETGGGWSDWYGPWNSAVKIHAAGLLSTIDGVLFNRGIAGYYWSSTHTSNSQGSDLYFYNTVCYMNNDIWKPYGLTIRCLKDEGPVNLSSDFSTSLIEGQAPLNIQFADESTGNPTIWKWDFLNDGVYDAFIQNPAFVFDQPGNYSVKLLVQNSTTTDSIIKVNYITVKADWSCGDSITIDHVAGNVAPVSKTVTYATVTNIPGETSKCWIACNLGSDHQANYVYDSTESSAGWYWQFNRMQGYKHDGTTRTPETTWITDINEDLDWQAANDPCALELGGDWRIPAYTEWSNVDEGGDWHDKYDAWGSGLKLHAAGLLRNVDGSLAFRGQNGYYWSSSHSSDTQGWDLYFYSSSCYMNEDAWKPYGLTVRCLKDDGSLGLNSDFSATPLEGFAPLNVQFTDKSTGNPTAWIWDFQNDGVYDSFIQDPSFTYNEQGDYDVQLIVQNSAESDTFLIINYISVHQIVTAEICIVTVTPENHNQVVWEKQESNEIDSFNIYRETTQENIYEVIGSVAYGDSGIFTDESSNPQQRPYKYKLSARLISGEETALSNYHKTIHLTINEGPSGWNLIWGPYEGFLFNTYYIYRGLYADSLTLIDSISASFTSYTDINPPLGPLYYAIEIIREGGCDPGRSDGYDRSRSNTMFNGELGLNDNFETGIGIYPNPVHDILYITFNKAVQNTNAEVVIFDIHGKPLIFQPVENEKTRISIKNLGPGVYFIQVKCDQILMTRKLVVY